MTDIRQARMPAPAPHRRDVRQAPIFALQRTQTAPATVTCGSCVRFQPGTTSLGIGVCLATTNGLPPKEQRGYLAATPSDHRAIHNIAAMIRRAERGLNP